MSTERFVVDANLALYAFAPDHALPQAMHAVAEASRSFLLRAVDENAALFVPWLFFSEVTNTVTRNIGSGQLDVTEGETLLLDMMQLPWTPLLPKWRDVLDITQSLRRYKSGDSEFIAVALDTGSTLRTEDHALLSTTQNLKLPYPVLSVLMHPWVQQ
jgi:predicted nucleic acid-binding protein